MTNNVGQKALQTMRQAGRKSRTVVPKLKNSQFQFPSLPEHNQNLFNQFGHYSSPLLFGNPMNRGFLDAPNPYRDNIGSGLAEMPINTFQQQPIQPYNNFYPATNYAYGDNNVQSSNPYGEIVSQSGIELNNTMNNSPMGNNMMMNGGGMMNGMSMAMMMPFLF